MRNWIDNEATRRANGITRALIIIAAISTFLISHEAKGQTPDVPRSNIVGGVEVSGPDFPFVVYIDGGDWFCTGSLIADRWILTAAHCVVRGGVSPGSVAIERGYPDDYERSAVGGIVVHPEYDYSGAGFRNDAALIEIIEPFQSDAAVPLPFLDAAQRQLYAPSGTLATAVGYGYKENDAWSDGLRQVSIPMSTPADCRRDHVFVSENAVAHELTLCAGSAGKGINSGDSGGPLLVPTPNGWGQVGIASMRGRSESGDPVVSIYTRVPSVYDWIAETIDDTSRLYFPQFAVGPGMTSDFVIFNASETSTARAEFQFFDGQGQRVSLLTEEQSALEFAPFSSFTFSPSGTLSGSAVIVSDSPLRGFVRFKADGLGTVGLLAVDAPAPRWLIPVRGGTFRTGVAVYNSEDEEVSVSVSLINRSGGIVGSSEIALPANGKLLGFIDDFFPAFFVPGMELAGQVLVETATASEKLAVVGVEIGLERGDFNVLPVVPLD